MLILAYLTTTFTMYNYARKGLLPFQPLDFRDFVSDAMVFPIVEELIFRGILDYFTKNFTYTNELNAALFSLSHFIVGYAEKKYLLLLNQCITAFFLGYYLANFDNIWWCILIHIFFNTIVAIQLSYMSQYSRTQWLLSRSRHFGLGSFLASNREK